MINPLEFQESINKELQVVKNRVRKLIGDANWGEDGGYKEAVLKNIIKKYLPKNLSIASGFIIKKENNNSQEFKVSKQIDILIYDNSFPVIFSEGDFAIVIEDSVRGIIEVKSKIYLGRANANSFSKVLEKFNTFNDFLTIGDLGNDSIFKGIFSFDFEGNLDSEIIDEALNLSKGMVNHISLNSSTFMKYWSGNLELDPSVDCSGSFYNIYEIRDLSHSYFISNLIHFVCDKDLTDRYWISFPIPDTKESKRIRAVCLEHNF